MKHFHTGCDLRWQDEELALALIKMDHIRGSVTTFKTHELADRFIGLIDQPRGNLLLKLSERIYSCAVGSTPRT